MSSVGRMAVATNAEPAMSSSTVEDRTSARTSPASMAPSRRSLQPTPGASGEATEDVGVQRRVAGHLGQQPGQRGAGGRPAEQLDTDGDQRPEVAAQVVAGRHHLGPVRGEHGLVHEVGLGRPAPVDGRLVRPGPLGDGPDRQLEVADLLEEIGRRPQHGLVDPQVAGPAGAGGSRRRGDRRGGGLVYVP